MPFHSDQQPQLGTHKFSAVLSSDLLLPLMSVFFRSNLHPHHSSYTHKFSAILPSGLLSPFMSVFSHSAQQPHFGSYDQKCLAVLPSGLLLPFMSEFLRGTMTIIIYFSIRNSMLNLTVTMTEMSEHFIQSMGLNCSHSASHAQRTSDTKADRLVSIN